MPQDSGLLVSETVIKSKAHKDCTGAQTGGVSLICRLHESTFAVTPDLVEELESELKPFCAVAGLSFEECDERAGPWRNYYVGVAGDVDADEHEVLWPNQVRQSLILFREVW